MSTDLKTQPLTRWWYCLLFGIVLLSVFFNFFWIQRDSHAQIGCHTVWHEVNSLEVVEQIINRDEDWKTNIGIIFDYLTVKTHHSEIKATNLSLTGVVYMGPMFLHLDGRSRLILYDCIYQTFFVIFVFLVAVVGRHFFSTRAGIYAASLAAVIPGTVGLARKSNNMFSVSIVIMLLVLFLSKVKKCPRLIWPFVLGFLFVSGLMTSPVFYAFCIPLLVYHLSDIFMFDKKRIQRGVLFLVFLGIMVLFFRYTIDGDYAVFFEKLQLNMQEAFDKFTYKSNDFIGSAKSGMIDSFLFAPQDSICPCTQTTNVGFNLQTFLFYASEMIRYLTLPLFVFSFIGVVYLFFTGKVIRRKRLLLFAWSVGGYLLLSYYHIKWGKFMLPILPVLLIGVGAVLDRMRKFGAFLLIVLVVLVASLSVHESLYVPIKSKYLEKLAEAMHAHMPSYVRFDTLCEEYARIIDETEVSSELPKIAFLDEESMRFEASWLSDASVRFGNMLRYFIQRKYEFTHFWSVDEDNLQDFLDSEIIIMVASKVDDVNEFMREMYGIKTNEFEILAETDSSFLNRKGAYFYLLKNKLIPEQDV